ncbi:MAG: ABC transporter ATP-binding protein/permease [Candidatus Izimaplasma sp.]|nr:ABC transporter ATP-binding protein/permease [Candidatus Izimaplasma bacterium]
MIFGKAINKYYKENAIWFLIGILSLVIIDTLQLEIPGLIGNIIEGLEQTTLDSEGVFSILKTMGLYVSIIMVGRFIWRISLFGASRRFDYGLRNDMFAHAEKLPNEFYSRNKVGGLMAYFTNDLESVRRAVGPGMIMFVDTVYLGGLALFKMTRLSWKLTLFSALPMLIIALLGAYIGRIMRNKFKEAQHAFEDLSDYTNESLSGITVIKAFVKEKLEIIEFLKYNQRAKDKNIAFVKVQTSFQVMVRTIVGLIFVVILAYGGYLVYITKTIGVETFTTGDLTEFYMLFGSLIWPMMALARIINIRSRGKASLQRIERILNEEITVQDSDNVLDIDRLKGNIEFNHLTFEYPDAKKPVLKNINFKIKAGETVGILGRTGSGKTSIVDLLLRIYNIDKNQILLDGYDIMDLPIKKVRDSIGYVPQDGFLFSDSVKNNISLSFKHNDDSFKKVREVAMLSDVHNNIIEFSEGYDTVIGERGVTLSGGQRQRVAIARALMKNSPIMILDDSVSAVDTKTEETILNNLKKIRSGKTTLIIAHRISTVKDADKIIIVNDGTVVDVGTHDALIERCEFYADLVERQRLEDEMGVA